MKHYEEDISALLDNELSGAEEQAALFSHISACEECRAFFNDAMLLKGKTSAFFQAGGYVNKKSSVKPILQTLRKTGQKKVYRYASAAAGLSVIFLLAYGWLKILGLQDKLVMAEKNKTQLSLQISDSLESAHSFQTGAAKVIKSTAQLTGSQTKTAVNKNIRKISRQAVNTQLRKRQFVPEANSFSYITISKEDFITPQRVGN